MTNTQNEVNEIKKIAFSIQASMPVTASSANRYQIQEELNKLSNVNDENYEEIFTNFMGMESSVAKSVENAYQYSSYFEQKNLKELIANLFNRINSLSM